MEKQAFDCVWCHQAATPGGKFCSHCGRGLAYDAGRVIHSDDDYLIAEALSGGYGLWDLWAPADPIFVNPDLERVFDVHDRLPNRSSTGSKSRVRIGAGAIFLVFLIAAIYVAIHANKYHECTIQPGIFAWPSQCI